MTDKTIRIIRLHPTDSRYEIRKGHLERQWMDDVSGKYAYRCLPLNIANQHGWAMYLKKPVTVVWQGKTEQDSLKFVDNPDNMCSSAFGNGILTFSMPFLVRTPENYSLFISGAPNHRVEGAQALTGVFESDWAPYSFTMNWQITDVYRPVTFTPEDPICFFFPVERDLVEDFGVAFEEIEDQEEAFKEQYYTFNKSRAKFIKDRSSGWQKHYFQGKMPDGSGCPVSNHKVKLNLKNPT